jgi:hypothetical protein
MSINQERGQDTYMTLLEELAEKWATYPKQRSRPALLAFGRELLMKVAEEFPGYEVIGCAGVRRRIREFVTAEEERNG